MNSMYANIMAAILSGGARQLVGAQPDEDISRPPPGWIFRDEQQNAFETPFTKRFEYDPNSPHYLNRAPLPKSYEPLPEPPKGSPPDVWLKWSRDNDLLHKRYMQELNSPPPASATTPSYIPGPGDNSFIREKQPEKEGLVPDEISNIIVGESPNLWGLDKLSDSDLTRLFAGVGGDSARNYLARRTVDEQIPVKTDEEIRQFMREMIIRYILPTWLPERNM